VTPIEKAEAALNRQIDRIHANLLAAPTEQARQFLVQSLVVSVAIGEALQDYVKAIGEFAQSRHGALKVQHATLGAEHDALLKEGQALLERFKTNPGDQPIRKAIEQAQKSMASIQKTLRRGADALKRDVAPSMALIDELAVSLKHFGEAEHIDGMKRAIKSVIGHAGELYRRQPTLPAKGIIDLDAWEESAEAEIGQATDYFEAYAAAGYQAMLALEVMTLALSVAPPESAESATLGANEAAARRITAVTTRLAQG
jgi:hypothetical protein